jgi:hypothetical protein
MTDVLNIALRATCALVAVETRSDEGDDVLSALDTLCRALQESRCVEFVVDGFGQEGWPVDVRTDLLTVLEQLPAIAMAVRSEAKEFELDFFEQGIVRRLTFVRNGQEITVTCVSGTDWQPQPSTARLSVADLGRLLSDLRDDFLRYAAARCPACKRWSGLEQWSAATRALSSAHTLN